MIKDYIIKEITKRVATASTDFEETNTETKRNTCYGVYMHLIEWLQE